MGRILAIDYGEKNIGLAISDELQIIASPLDVIKNDDRFLERLKKLYEYYKFEKIVVGYPETPSPRKSQEKVKEFGQRIKDFLSIEVVYYNEAFTTVYARNFLSSLGQKEKKIKKIIDKIAAQKILEDYLKNKPQDGV
ncbi:MAG: Holliday junction resolvase RuvX [Brevinematales bacterium]|nr:Holliday junction resolvase RuvX [Brevinematales bacterium]